MTTSRWARRLSPAETTATSTPISAALGRERGPQLRGPGARHRELDGGDRVLRQPEDTVDVPAGRGDGGRYGGGRLGGERVPQHRHMGTAVTAGPVVTDAGDDLGLQLQGVGPAVHGRPQVTLGRPARRGRGDQGAQHDAATGDDLLDVHDVDRVRGEGVEEPGGDTGTVLAEDLDQQRGCVAARRGRRRSRRPDGARGAQGTQRAQKRRGAEVAEMRSWCFHRIGPALSSGRPSRVPDGIPPVPPTARPDLAGTRLAHGRVGCLVSSDIASLEIFWEVTNHSIDLGGVRHLFAPRCRGVRAGLPVLFTRPTFRSGTGPGIVPHDVQHP